MWDKLPAEKKKEYKRMILAFTSLSEMFSQKSDDDGSDGACAPIINTKYQETMFKKAFGATIEDIGNTSYDASLDITDDDGRSLRCLVGIKTFGIGSGAQKIAQFKSEHGQISALAAEAGKNAAGEDNKPVSKEEIDLKNQGIYKEIALLISEIRNERIRSSKENIRGFVESGAESGDDKEAESVYHVLMPSKKGEDPKIYVGETSYDEIDIPNIKIFGCTSAGTPMNFSFTDGNHDYQFNTADSQLFMKFNNRDIVKETWDVLYADDAYEIFSDIFDDIYKDNTAKKARITESYSWSLLNRKGEAELFSGFNTFFGVGSKMGRGQRNSAVNSVREEFKDSVDADILDGITKGLETFLLTKAPSFGDKEYKVIVREEIMELAESTGNTELVTRLEKLMFRPADELYIPIPDSRKFHEQHPDFFAKNAGSTKPGSSKLALTKEERTFNLVFEPSGNVLKAYITQDNGKAIESAQKQSYLGNWILRGIFQLNAHEPLTAETMNRLGINGIRLYRTDADDGVHLEFIWIDKDNPPDDLV